MAYFYSWSLDQIRKLSVDEFELFWQAITIIESQEMLKLFNVSDWPNMKKSGRLKLHKQLYRQAYPASLNETKQLAPADFAKILGG